MEDIQHAICLSQAQLEYTEKVIHDQIHKASPVLVLATDYVSLNSFIVTKNDTALVYSLTRFLYF